MYRHILLGLDFHPNHDDRVAERALAMAKQHDATLTIVHAVEHINAYGVEQAYPIVLDVEERMLEEGKIEMRRFGERYHIPEQNQIVEIGAPKLVLLDKAKALNVDLIVVGSHGRHGFDLLLGSTASAILHHAPCDVLAVRVHE